MTSADVVIIGSGPAGWAAASVCARAGLGVLLIGGSRTADAGDDHDYLDATTDAVVDKPVVPLESIHPGVGSLLHQIGADGVIIVGAPGETPDRVETPQADRSGCSQRRVTRCIRVGLPK